MWSTKVLCPYCQENVHVDKFDLSLICSTFSKDRRVETTCPRCDRPFTVPYVPASVVERLSCEESAVPFTLFETLLVLVIIVLLLLVVM